MTHTNPQTKPSGSSAHNESHNVQAGAVPTGNTFDKYGSGNPAVRLLMQRFERTLANLLHQAKPQSILDVGCGEGVLCEQWAQQLGPSGRVAGIDLEDAKLQSEWARRQHPNLEFYLAKGEQIPFADNEFDLSTAIEVLEHVEDPAQTLAEMTRCARSHLLVSVPREPLWRIVNMARGAYWSSLGNTTGHVNHWSKRSFARLLGDYGTVCEVRSPFPWTMCLVQLER